MILARLLTADRTFLCAPFVVRGYSTAKKTSTTKDSATTTPITSSTTMVRNKTNKKRSLDTNDLNDARLRMLFKARTEDPGIVDPYVPPEVMPRFPSRLFFAHIVKRAKNAMKNTYYMGMLQRAERKHRVPEHLRWGRKGKSYSARALDAYTDMNNLFAEGNLKELEKICESNMFQTLKSQIKKRQEGKYVWQFHGVVENPKYVSVRAAKFTHMGHFFSQIMLRFHTKQSLAVYNRNGNLISGDPHNVRTVREFVVFQRRLWEPDSIWRIYGYYRPDQAMLYPGVAENHK